MVVGTPMITWKRTNEQEPAPDLPKVLLYHPLTGDGDFQYLPLEDRLEQIIYFANREGFSEGFHAGRTAVMDEIEKRLNESHSKDHQIDYDRYCMDCPDAYDVIRELKEYR